MRTKAPRSKVVLVALAANVAIALTKFAAAAITGSSAMLSEGVHSLVDTINELLLLYGIKRAAKRPDKSHPFGYGRELYFWSFVVALLVLALGAGVSFYEGVTCSTRMRSKGRCSTTACSRPLSSSRAFRGGSR